MTMNTTHDARLEGGQDGLKMGILRWLCHSTLLRPVSLFLNMLTGGVQPWTVCLGELIRKLGHECLIDSLISASLVSRYSSALACFL